MKAPKPLPRISAKKLKSLGGSVPFSSITGKRKPVKRRNAKRKASEWARAYGSEDRLAFVAALPCVVPGCRVTPCENAHTSGDGGAGYKASAKYIVPLCYRHHEEQHRRGAGSFAIKYEINLRDAAAATEKAWQDHIAHEARNGQ